MIVPNEVKYILDKLKDSGYEAYLVGGCTRDYIMGLRPKDFDVTTNAKPQEVHNVFDYQRNDDPAHLIDTGIKQGAVHLIDTGIKQGTVTVVKNHVPVEVTTYRTEGRYSDNRHPDEVSFSESIKEDLARRDFTMNAIAWDPQESKTTEDSFVDPYGGISDISGRLIRCVGNPRERFSEDALRIIRALRFSSVLDFEIEAETEKAIFELKESLNNISKERIQKELEGLLCGKAVERVLRTYADILAVVIPEIKPMIGFDQCTPYHIFDVWEHTIRVVGGVPGSPALRLAALFHDIGKPSCFTKDENGIGHFYGHPEVSAEMTTQIMRRLKFDNATRDDVLTLVRWHDLRPEATEKSVRKVITKIGAQLFDSWIAIKLADNGAQAPLVTERKEHILELQDIGHRLINTEGELSLKTLEIKGSDLISMGVSEGPEIGRILHALLQEVLDENIPNEKEELSKAALSIIECY